MDKPRITIKLNQPKNQNIQNTEKIKPSRETLWKSQPQESMQDHMSKVEMEIREANRIQQQREKELAERQLNAYPEIDLEGDRYQSRSTKQQPKVVSWFASSEDSTNSRRPSYSSKRRPPAYPRKSSDKKRGTNFQDQPQILKTIGVGIGAVVTGILFGFILLHFFITPMMTGADSIQTNANVAQSSANSQAIIPQKTIYLLQSGVFTDKNGAVSAVEQYKENGKAAIVKEGASNHVFVGIAPDKTLGQTLVELLKADGQDTYLKAYTINESQTNMSNETFQQFIAWNTTGDQMAQWLATNSISLLKDPKAFIDDKEIQKLHQQFLNEVQVVHERLVKEGKTKEQEIVKNMANQMNYAMTAYSEFRKGGSSQYLWNIQTSLMNYQMAYESFGQK